MIIEWEQDVYSCYELPFQLVADCCQIAESISLSLAVHVRLTNDSVIRKINQEYRNIDRSTDVLSFPTVNYSVGRTAKSSKKLLKMEYDPELGACMLGDIILSYDHVVAQAQEYGHSVQREFCYLFAHGLFHLMGYDHMKDDEKKEMRKMEENALRMAGLSINEPQKTATDEELLELARMAMKRSYSPYSHYPVGAALLCANGKVFQGCNIENASFGLTNCAERTAVFKAVSEGEYEFSTIAIASVNSAPYPCGACRQVLNEFAPNIRLLVTWGNGQVEETTLRELLPHGFGPKDLD